MKKLLITVFAVLLFAGTSIGQPLTGVKSIPGDYSGIAAAIISLNTNGVGAGGVVFNVAANHKETFSSPDAGHITTTTGSAANPIVIQKFGAGANPLITSASGGGNMDAVFMVSGCDYVTFDGLDIQEDPKNADPLSLMEWGFAILKASGTDGSQNITIKNCTITLDYNNTASTGIYSNNHTSLTTSMLSVTAATGTNSNLKIFGNTIHNSYRGIYLNGFAAAAPYTFYDQYNEVGKDGANIITHVGGSDVIAYGIYAAGQNDLKIANNTVTSTTEGDKDIYGIYLTASNNASYDLYGNTVSIQYNSWDGYNADLFGIYSNMGASGTSNVVNIYNNTVTNCTYPNTESASFYGLYATNLGVTGTVYGNVVNNNTIGSTNSASAGPIRYLWIQKISTTAGPLVVHSNSVNGNARIQAFLGGGTTQMLAIAGSGTTLDAYNNIVENNVAASYQATSCLYVIYIDANGKNVYNNTVSNITEANGSVTGLYNSGGSTAYIYNNKVQGIYSAGNASQSTLSGILCGQSGSSFYYNNMVSELSAPASISTLGYDYNTLNGIYVESGTTFNGFYNNTVYINTTTNASEFGSSAFCAVTLTGVDLRNNIFVNTSASAGSNGKTVAIRVRSTSLAAYTSNYNDLYAGVPGLSNLIFTNGAAMDQTLVQYQSRVAPNDMQSVSTMPPFVNVATSPYDVHLKTNVPTACESGGVVVANPIAVSSDFDGQPRYPNSGYPVNPSFPATAPDLGADEFGGISSDLTAPNIQYTPLSDINNGNARTFEAVITDATGVPTSSFGLPVLYWRKNGAAYIAVQGVFMGSDTYTFTFGGGSVLNDVIDYYLVAQDLVTPFPNVIGSPFQGSSGYSVNPPFCSTPPANPLSYKVINEISGIKHVGIGKDYNTLTAAAADLNSKYMAGPVTFVLDDNIYPNETFPIKFNSRPGNSVVNSLTIMPNTGASPVITGNKQGQSILVMNGLDFVTIDGSNNGTTTKDITIENTSYTGNASVIGITNNNGSDPSKFVTIKNCHLIGTKSYNPYIDTYVILFNQGGGLNGGGYDNILITANHIKKAKMGISILASENNLNRFITIHNNILGSADSNFYLQRWGIAVENSANTMISNNDIMGSALGAPFDQIFGIIYYGKCSNTKIHNNKIHDWFALGLGSSGIKCSNENDATPTEIFNNLIYNIKTPGLNPGVGNNAAYGIFVRWGGNIKIWHNTIYLSGDFLTGFDSYAPSSACLGFYEQSTNNFDIRNNIFRNSMTNSANPTDTIVVRGRAYGIMFTGPVTKFSVLDHNDYFINGFRGAIAQHWASGMGFIAEIDSLEEWQAYTGQEAHSIYSNPGFISDIDPKNLHPTSMQLNSSGSAKILDNDIDGAIRYSPSDMGAYEWSNLITDYHTLAATDVTETSAILNGDINTKGELVEVYFEYGTTTAYGSGIIPVPPAVRSMGVLQPVIAAVTGLQSNTTYHFRFWGVPKTSLQANVYGEDMLFTTAGSSVPVNLTVSDTISSDTCFNATNTITVAGNGATLVVNAGASATFIAGQKILFLPGTKVLAGGYMHGYITLDNQYCNQPFNALVGNTTGDDKLKSSVADPVSSPSIRVYPNPANGPVTIEITGKTENGMSRVDFYSLSGVKVMSKELEFPGKHSVSVSELPNGIYFLRLVVGNETKTTKLIKM